jgi:pimeloyl-ACP methyl ester carboxylesterase
MLFTILAVIGFFLFIAAVVAAVVVWRRPLAAYGHLSRSALRRAGLHRQVVATGVGEQTAFVGGHGPTVVLLHGAGDQAGTWARNVPALLPHFRLVVLDLPGHGESAPKSGPLSVGTVVDGVADVLDVLVPNEPWTIVGNSLGAWVALLVAVRRPSRIGRLVLVNGGALKGGRSDITFTPSTREEARATIGALMGPSALRAPGFVLDDLIRVCRVGPLGRLVQTADEMDRYLLDGRLGAVTAPVDLLWGSDDQVFPVSYAERMERELPASRLTLLPGCGHAPHRNHPRRFNTALADLLAAAAPETSSAPR